MVNLTKAQKFQICTCILIYYSAFSLDSREKKYRQFLKSLVRANCLVLITYSSGTDVVKSLLTLDTERDTSNFDIGGKLGQCCILNHCIAGKHELHFVKTCLFLRQLYKGIIL